MSSRDGIVPIGRVASGGGRPPDGLPGSVRRRGEVPPPAAYAVVDCETTGTDPAVDEIVSLAIVRLGADGVETARYTSLVRPSCPIPPEATAVHGIGDEDVARAPRFVEIAADVLGLLDGAVFVAHNAAFDLGMLQHALAQAGADYRPVGVACTLDAFRLLEPRELSHRLESICERRGITLGGAHEALGDVVATAALLRVLLERRPRARDGAARPPRLHAAPLPRRHSPGLRAAGPQGVRTGPFRGPALPGRKRRPRPGRRARRAGRWHHRRRFPHARAGAGRLRRARAR